MDGFEFIFSLFGLLLGFSLVEVIAGFGRTVAAALGVSPAGGKPTTRAGWLSPLLGLFVCFNLISFWTAAWSLRSALPVGYLPLLFGLLVTGGYYFAASLVFPAEHDHWDDLDRRYFHVKRWVVGIIAGCNAIGAAGAALAGVNPWAGAVWPNLLFFTLLAALVLAPGKRRNGALLVLLVCGYPLMSLLAAAL